MKRLLLLLFMSSVISLVKGQDRIFTIYPADTINCKIVEITDRIVTYTRDSYSEGLILSMEKNNISHIMYANGKEITFSKSSFKKENNFYKTEHIIKLSLLSPIFGYTLISFEQNVKTAQSYELSLGVVGAGYDYLNENPFGVIIKAGYKFMSNPTSKKRYRMNSSELAGWYLKPELAFVSYKQDDSDVRYIETPTGTIYQNYTFRKTINTASIMLIGGKQWINQDHFTVDFFAGVGYAIGDLIKTKEAKYAFLTFQDGTPISLITGIKLGYLF